MGRVGREGQQQRERLCFKNIVNVHGNSSQSKQSLSDENENGVRGGCLPPNFK